MKKILILLLCITLCLALLCACGTPNDDKKPEEDTPKTDPIPQDEPEEYVLFSNSEKATMRADKDFKTVIQITNTYPDELLLVFDDPEIATCEWAQWVGNKGSLTFTGLKKGETTLTIYAGAANGDVSSAKAGVTVHVIVEDDPTAQ